MSDTVFDFETPTDVKAVIDSLPPTTGGRFGKKSVNAGSSAKSSNPPTFTKHGIKKLNEMHPGKYWKADHITTDFRGVVSKKDLLGFGDIAGIERGTGRMIIGQMTTPGQLSAHYRKYTSPNHTTGTDKVPIETHIREFLECGGLFYIMTWEKPGRFWEPTVIPFTLQTIEEIYSRKRPRK